MRTVVLSGLILSLVLLVAESKPQVLLLSFDGFRYDYIDKYKPPNFMRLIKEGVHAEKGVRASFVTKTFPDHYTLATGLYEESHGIIGNRMWDPDMKSFFNFSSYEPQWWEGGEPIWITARKQKLVSGVYFWPGSEVVLQGMTANKFVHYNKSIGFEVRVSQAVEWLVKDKMDLVMMYFYEPDKSGHQGGAFSDKVQQAINRVDSTLGFLLKKLEKNKALESVDIIVVSDHGMTNVTFDRHHVLPISEVLQVDQDIERLVEEGTSFSFYPNQARKEQIYQTLKNYTFNMTVYKKEDIPTRFHYKNNKRVPPIFILPDEGYLIMKEYNKTLTNSILGQHGYDNMKVSMKPIFLARGPHFKKGFKMMDVFETVNLYPLLCHILDIEPAPNNGSLKAVQSMLVSSTSSVIPSFLSFILPVVLGFLSLGVPK